MDYKNAIEVIKSNYPPEQYTMLREALDLGIKVLEEKVIGKENTLVIDVEKFYKLEKEYSNN